MAITLADIDRWDPSAVREVSTALGKRGASADEVRAGLGKLPLIASWQGSGGDAARAGLDKLSSHLVAHADEMAAAASATSKAADEIESVKQTQFWRPRCQLLAHSRCQAAEADARWPLGGAVGCRGGAGAKGLRDEAKGHGDHTAVRAVGDQYWRRFQSFRPMAALIFGEIR
jgi:uncharacterized protein YukE